MDQKGSFGNPIQILQQDQEMKVNQQRIQYERNRQAIYRAHMGSPFDVAVAIIKLEIKGSDEYKDKVIKQRIRKYFSASTKTINAQNENFRVKRQPDYKDASILPVPNQLIIYGVDFLNTKQIKQKFIGLNVTVQWLDDSHCKVIFKDAQEAKSGIQMNLKNQQQNLVKLQQQNIQVPRCWFQLRPYFYLTFQRKLECRYAASNENQPEINRSNDYYMYQQAKKQYEQSIIQQLTEQKYFEVMKKLNLIGDRRFNDRMRMGSGSHASYRRSDYRSNQRSESRSNWDRDGRGDRNRGGGWNRDRDNSNSNYGNRDREFNRRQVNYNSRRNYNNNYSNNRRDNQEQLQIQMRQPDRSRNKRQNPDFDNISRISESNLSHRSRKPRKQSLSLCSHSVANSPQRNAAQDGLDNEEGFSFILGQDQLSIAGSEQVVNQIGNLSLFQGPDFNENTRMNKSKLNLSINSNSNQLNQKYVPKQQQLNLSYVSNQQQLPMPKNNTSFNESQFGQKNSRGNRQKESLKEAERLDMSYQSNLNDSIANASRNMQKKKFMDTSFADDGQGVSLNKEQHSAGRKKMNSSFSRIYSNDYDQEVNNKKKVNTSIQQIQIYDDD